MKTFFFLALLVSVSVSWAQNEHAAHIEALKTYRFGGNEAPLNAIAGWVRSAGSDATKRRAVAQSLASVLTSDASFDAKQFACRQLALVGGEEQVPALAMLLKDETLAHYAVMALVRIPSIKVNEALRQVLGQSTGKARLEIIAGLGERRDKEAVGLLATFLKSDDDNLIKVTSDALGGIGDANAIALLREAYVAANLTTNNARKDTLAQALLENADRLREAGATGNEREAAASVYEQLQGDSTSPLGAGALRGLVLLRGEKSLPLLLDALSKDLSPQQKMAAALSLELPGAAVTKQLGARLPQLSPNGQMLLLSALGERGDVGAAPAIAGLLSSNDEGVRTAAAQAIGAIGDANTVPLLLNLAATGAKEGRDVARSSLLRLKGQSIDEKLLSLIEKNTATHQAEAINSLRERRVTSSIPRILPLVKNNQPEVRLAALTLLRDMAAPSDLTALLEYLPAIAPAGRGALLDTVAEIARRGKDDSERSAALLKQFSNSKNLNDKADLLMVLGRVGSTSALKTLRSSLGDKAPEIRLAALRGLSGWESDEPLDDLRRVAQNAPDEKTRILAARGYIRLIGLPGNRAPEERLALYRQALVLDNSAEAKRAAIAGVSKLKSVEALGYASEFLKDETVRGEAELAVVEIARGTLGAHRDKSRTVVEPIAKNSTNENARKGAQEVLALADKLGEFVTAWEVSPAYEQAGANSSQLFDIAFAPEKAEAQNTVPWRLMPVATSAGQPWLLDLLALHGGEQRVAYLRTSVWSEKERDVVLESGSDDGTKAWLNGQIVLSNNAQRAVEPGQDKTKLKLKAGWNDLMLKITQNNMGWGAVARFTNSDGSPAKDLKFALPTQREKRN
jgi:HEAT repeat protein